MSQREHLSRALFLARHMGVEARGYDAIGGAPIMLLQNFRAMAVVLYAFWNLVIGPSPAEGPRVAIGVDPPA